MAFKLNSLWTNNLSFSDRFENISNICKWLQKRESCPAVEAQQKARGIEKSIFESAHSLDEYKQLCDASVAISINLDDAADEAFSEDGGQTPLSPAAVRIGHFPHAIHYRDGLFSEVYKATCSEGQDSLPYSFVALKVTTPSIMVAPHNSEREARILRSIHKHDNITPLLEAFYISGSRYVLAFPFFPFGLDSLLGKRKLNERHVKSHLQDMFRGLMHLHDNNIIHRDVKPSNILLKAPDGPAFLADFGIAWSASDPASEEPSEKITDVGTTCYRAPEILFGQKDYDASLDMWAAGCVVAEAVNPGLKSLFEPGQLGTELALIQSIFMSLGTPNHLNWPSAARCPDWGKMQWKEFDPRPWSDLLPNASTEARALASKLVCYEPAERLTANLALDHPFLVSRG